MSGWHDRVFFGIHYDLHARANDTELGRDVTPELLRAAWQRIRPDWIQCDCKGHPGYTSWPSKTGYASPGLVRDALRVHRDVTRELGLPLVMHYSGIWDGAAIERHPDWARVGPDGQRVAARACPRGPYLTRLLIPQMLELVDEYDVDGFWVDGDIWSTAPCYCGRCAAAFRDESGLAVVPRAPGQPGWAWWLAFHRRSYDDYVRAYVEAVHARKPDCQMCVNWLYSVRHPDNRTLPVDFLSGDFTHAWGVERAAAEARFLASRGIAWDLMAWGFSTGEAVREGWHFKTVPHLCQEAAEVIANGGALSVYLNLPRGGHLVFWQHDVLAEVAAFCRARQAVSVGCVSVPQAVVLHAASHVYAHNEPLYGLGQANLPMEGAMHALLDVGRHVDIKNEDALLASLADYPLVVIAEQDPISDVLAAALPSYVEAGGRLVLSGAHVARHAELAALAGVETAGPAREGYHYLPVADGSSVATVTVGGPWQPVRALDAPAWAMLAAGPEPGKDDVGSPAITIRQVGRGRVAAIHGPVFAAYLRTRYPRLRRLLRALVDELWPDPAVELRTPGHVVLTLRRRPGRTVVHLLNRGASPATSTRNVMVEEVPPVGPVSVRLRLAARPSSVHLVPEGALEWAWSGDAVEATLPSLDIHAALVADE